VEWPINSAGSSLTFRGAGISLSPSKVEERFSPALKRVGGTSFYWQSGDRLSFRPTERSGSVSRLASVSPERRRSRSLDRWVPRPRATRAADVIALHDVLRAAAAAIPSRQAPAGRC